MNTLLSFRKNIMEEQKQNDYVPANCVGNACSSVSLREIFAEDGRLTSILLNNSDSSAVKVTLIWTSFFFASVETTTTIFPNETIPIDNPQDPNGKYCGIKKAVKNSKELDDSEKESDATFYRAYCETEGKWLGNWNADQQVAINSANNHSENNSTHVVKVRRQN